MNNTVSSIHVVVDMLYDFIDGTLACQNSEEAVKESVEFINNYTQMPVAYICDHHPENHCSFKEFGGIWPPHCVQGTKGGSIHQDYYKKVSNKLSRPNEENTFYKGRDPNREEYSGYEAENPLRGTLEEYLNTLLGNNEAAEVYISGIATEFCINATVRDIANSGRKVYLISDALGYVDKDGHDATIAELSDYKNVTII